MGICGAAIGLNPPRILVVGAIRAAPSTTLLSLAL
jgi:hypothetical protein